MTLNEIDRIIRKIVAQVAGLSMLELEPDQLLREELMLDSLKELEIVARTEVQLGVTLDEGDLIDIRTLADFEALVMRSLVDEGSQIGRG